MKYMLLTNLRDAGENRWERKDKSVKEQDYLSLSALIHSAAISYQHSEKKLQLTH